MAETEVLKALNVLKRADKINSILFFEEGNTILYLSDVIQIDTTPDRNGNYELVYGGERRRWKFSECNFKKLIRQWKLAKLATAFLR